MSLRLICYAISLVSFLVGFIAFKAGGDVGLGWFFWLALICGVASVFVGSSCKKNS